MCLCVWKHTHFTDIVIEQTEAQRFKNLSRITQEVNQGAYSKAYAVDYHPVSAELKAASDWDAPWSYTINSQKQDMWGSFAKPFFSVFPLWVQVEVKPYVLDDQMCDECQGTRCGGKFAPFFCANVTCLQYYCEYCWASIHSRAGREFHKPLVKEGGDRPRHVPFRWSWATADPATVLE